MGCAEFRLHSTVHLTDTRSHASANIIMQVIIIILRT